MVRKITVSLCCLFLCGCLIVSVFGDSRVFVADEAGLLSWEEITLLQEKAEKLEDQYGIHAVILAVDSLGGVWAQDFAEDYYDRAGYGEDGVLFLLAMAEREWYISTSGRAIYALTDYGIAQIGEGSVAFFGDGSWFEGFGYFLDTLPMYLEALEYGVPVDGYADDSGSYYHVDPEEILYYETQTTPSLLLSVICGIAVAGIVILIMRFCMNTKRPSRCAGEYMIDGSWNLTQRRDIFLYSNVTKVRKQEPPKHTGGGSSVHRSSGGRRHGGGGGRF